MPSSSLGTVASNQVAAACTGLNASAGWEGMKQVARGGGVGPLPKTGLAFPLPTAIASSQDSIAFNGSVLGSHGKGSQSGTRPRPLLLPRCHQWLGVC